MPLKKIGLMDKSITPIKSTYAIASSSFYQKIIAESFGLNIDEVLPVGQPRIDLLYRKIDCLQKFKIKINENQRIILWTPTYRQSVVGDIRTDGNHTQDLPLIGRESLMELNIFLNDLNIFLLVKLHPMDKLNTKVFEEYSNIRILKNEDLEAVNVQLYSIMAEVDILLTDYSSIYIDFLYLKKPIAFIFEDIDSYTKSRGFVFSNPLDFMPGAIITNFEELKSFLDLVVNENLDYYKNNRQNLHEKLNSEFKNYSQQLLNAIDFI
jgi:CDP-glycerol glycerophosphotransferase (TagB/SpsB family)